jgi:hypothetical protein
MTYNLGQREYYGNTSANASASAGRNEEVVDGQVCSWLAGELSMMRKAIERQASVISLPWLGKDRPDFTHSPSWLLGTNEDEPAVVTSLYLKVIINPILLRSAHPSINNPTHHATTTYMQHALVVAYVRT